MVAAGEVAVAVVEVAVEEVAAVGRAVTATPFATAAGKWNDPFDDTTLGNGLPPGSAFDVDHFLFPCHLFTPLQQSRCHA